MPFKSAFVPYWKWREISPAKIERLFRENITAYAHQIVRNECLRLLKKINRETSLAHRDLELLNGYSFRLNNIGERKDMNALLDCLKDREKEAILLWNQGYAYKEIAEKMVTTVDGIKGLIKRARPKLKAYLEHRGIRV